MAADPIASIIIDHHESDTKNLSRRIVLGDSVDWGHRLESHTLARLLERCDGLCMKPNAYAAESTPIINSLHLLQHETLIESLAEALIGILNSKQPNYYNISAPELPHTPLPTYQEALADEPPQYTLREDLVPQDLLDRLDVSPCPLVKQDSDFLIPSEPHPSMPVYDRYDIEEPSGIISYAKKKDKQAQKAAQQAKWGDDGEEGSKEGAKGEEHGGDGSGGGDAPGGGGDNNGDGGGGDDGWGGGDDWDQGAGKKKKKGKKQKEEEERKKKEEEDEAKRKEEESANNTFGGDPLSWANEGDTKPDDDWGAFTTTGKNKKKDKKKKNEPEASANCNSNGGPSAFADIALNDDIPKIDMSFETTKDDKPSSSGFGLGSWGNSIGSTWGLGGSKTTTTSSWGFDDINGDSTEIAATNLTKDTKTTSTDVTESSWSFGGNKKNKKKETASSFNFDTFGADEGNGGELHLGETGDTNLPAAAEEDPWASTFTAVKKGGKKDKKKKGAIEEMPETEPQVVDVPPKDETADSFGGFGSWGKSKKDKVIDVPPPPPPAPVVPTEDTWSAPTITKGKKKKKGAFEESFPTHVPPPPPIQVIGDNPSLDIGGDDGWAEFSFDNDKKKNIKEGIIDVVQDDPQTNNFDVGYGTTNDDGWGFGAKKGKAKKGKGGTDEVKGEDPISVLSPVTTNDTTAAESNDWGDWGTAGKKNAKPDKAKKGAKISEPTSPPPPPAATSNFDFFGTGADTGLDSGWGSFGNKDKKKKDKLMSFDDDITDVPFIEDKEEPAIDPFAGLSPREKKKKEKELEKEKKEKEKAEKEKEEKEANEKEKEEKEAKERAEAEAAAADPLAGLIGSARRRKEKELKEAKEKADREAVEKAKVEEVPVDPLAGLFGMARKRRKEELEKEKLEKEKADQAEKEAMEKEQETAPIDPLQGLTGVVRKRREKELKEAEKAKAKEEERRIEEEREKELERERELEAEKAAAEQKEREKKDKKAGKKPGWGSTFAETKSMWGATTTETKDDPKVGDFLSGTTDLAGLDAGGVDDWTPGWAKPDAGKKKKGSKKEVPPPAPPPAPTPPAQGLTPEPEAPLDDVISWDTGGFSSFGMKSRSKTAAGKPGVTGKDGKVGLKSSMDKSIDLLSTLDEPPLATAKDALKKTTSKEETPAKATSRFGGWGFGGSTSAKDKLAKEKAAKEEEEMAAKEKEEDDNLLLELVDEELEPELESEPEPEPEPEKPTAKKGKGGKMDSKSTKASAKTTADKAGAKSKDAAKENDKDKEMTFDELLDLDGELDDSALNKYNEELEAENDGRGESWGGFWGAKKPAGPKGDELKREITKSPPANQKASLSKAAIQSKELEGTAAEEAFVPPAYEESKATTKFSTKDKAGMFGGKASTGKPSVVEKVKALEKERLAKEAAKSVPPPPPPPPAPEPQLPVTDEPLARKVAPFKSKGASATKPSPTSKKTKEPVSLSPFDQPDTVPGSFPSEYLLDGLDDDDIVDFEPVVEKKSTKKPGKVSKASKMAPATTPIVEAPMPPSAPPTPPPETPATKPVKKERARVVRDPGATSWGLWGATPKKTVKPAAAKVKDDANVASPSAKKSPPKGAARSKSTKTPKEAEKEGTVRSSGSDPAKKPPTRPASKARGSSFSFFGPPPARTNKPPISRRNSTAARSTSRRQSVDVAAAPTGLPSPPPEDFPEMNDKAAKVFGKVNRKASTKTKSKVPDPYAIDSDDNVLVNVVEDPVINAPVPKTKNPRPEKLSRSKSKRESKYAPEPAGEDIVMVEADAFGEEASGGGNGEGYENVYPQRSRDPPPPAPLKRSATNAPKRPDGLIGGLFGSFRKNPRRQSEIYDKPKSRSVYADEPAPTPRKKRAVAGRDDDPKRLRREDRKVRRSDRDVEAEGFTTDAPPALDREAEEAEARRAERHARRADRENRAKAAEDRVDEEKKARDLLNDKAATEARKAKIRELRGLAPKADEAANGEEHDRDVFSQEDRPSRRKGEDGERRRHRDRSDREPRERSSRREKALPARITTEEADRRARHDERRSSKRTSERPSGSRRKSTAPAAPGPADGYFDSRNVAPDANPYSHEAPRPSGNPHTASWVESLEADQPEPPPVAETVLDPPPGEEVKEEEEEEDEEEARQRRKAERRRRREGGGSGGSGEGRGEREKSRGRGGRRDVYDAPPTTRPGLGGLGGGRRESWFSKITSF